MLTVAQLVFGLLSSIGPIGKIIGYIAAGSILAFTVFSIISFVSMQSVRLSERVCGTKRGTRYYVVGILLLLLSVFEMITNFRFADVLMLLYAGTLIIGGSAFRKKQ